MLDQHASATDAEISGKEFLLPQIQGQVQEAFYFLETLSYFLLLSKRNYALGKLVS